MPPPVSYVDITSVPFSRVVTQAEFNVANEFWFRFVTATDIVLGNWTSRASGVGLFTNIYQSDGTTLVKRVSSSAAFWYLLAAGTYYIKIDKFPVGSIAADFTYKADTRIANPTGIASGSYLITDDNSDQLAGSITESDGTVLGFTDGLPTGEIGDSLPSGIVLLHDRFGLYALRSVILFDADLAHVSTITPSPALGDWPRITNNGTDFFVIDSGGLNWGNIFKVTAAGVITLIGTLPLISQPTCVGVSRDGKIFYWGEYNSASIYYYNIDTLDYGIFYTIPGFDTSNDYVAVNPNFNPGELLVLPDGSIVTWWVDDSGSKNYIIHISSLGVLTNSYEFAIPTNYINHINFVSSTLSTHIAIWFFNSYSMNQSVIGKLNLTTGLLEEEFTTSIFFSGQTGINDDETMFGPSNSCPFMVLSYGSASVNDHHIFLMSDRRNDNYGSDEAIPNPFFITGLLGD